MNRVLVVALCMSVALPAFAQKPVQEDTFNTSGGDLKITFLGHGTLMFTFGGKSTHVDPMTAAASTSSARPTSSPSVRCP